MSISLKRSSPPTRRRSRSALSSLDLDGAFFWLLIVFLLTVFLFLSLRQQHLQLSAHQVAEYERRSQFLSNSTVYIVETSRPENLLSKLSAADWEKASTEIDYVAFVFDDLPLFLTEDWVAAAERVFKGNDRVKHGVGIAIFACGCVIPNRYFTLVDVRLAGYECLLLPGWVLDVDDVHFMDVAPANCRRRQNVLQTKLAERYKHELKLVHDALEAAKTQVEANHVQELDENEEQQEREAHKEEAKR